jgi:hypothetical protein
MLLSTFSEPAHVSLVLLLVVALFEHFVLGADSIPAPADAGSSSATGAASQHNAGQLMQQQHCVLSWLSASLSEGLTAACWGALDDLGSGLQQELVNWADSIRGRAEQVRLSAVPLLVCLFMCCDHHCKAGSSSWGYEVLWVLCLFNCSVCRSACIGWCATPWHASGCCVSLPKLCYCWHALGW